MAFHNVHQIFLCSLITCGYSLPVEFNVTIISTNQSSNKSNQAMPGAVVVSALILIYLLHQAQIVKGFTLCRGKHRCTDFYYSIQLLTIAILWTVIVFYTAFRERWDSNEDGPVCGDSYRRCLSSITAAPWFLLFVSIYWVFDYLRNWSTWGVWLYWLDAYLSAFMPKPNSKEAEEKPEVPPRIYTMRRTSSLMYFFRAVREFFWKAIEHNFPLAEKSDNSQDSNTSDSSQNVNKSEDSQGTVQCKRENKPPDANKPQEVFLSPGLSDISSSSEVSEISDWHEFIGIKGRILLSSLILGATTVMVWSSWSQGLKSLSLISAVGCIIFISKISVPNPYNDARHKYAADTLRVVFPTREERDIVYILPSKDCGFDAVYCPKIAFEHKELERLTEKAGKKGRDAEPIWHKDNSIFLLFTNFIKATSLKKDELNYLARWLFCADYQLVEDIFPDRKDFDAQYKLKPETRQYACKKKAKAHLIGKNLLFALWQLEFLLYDKRYYLDPKLQRANLKFKWRGETTRITQGAGAKGNKPGREGYKEAVKYVYQIFGCDETDKESLEAAQKPSYKREDQPHASAGDRRASVNNAFRDKHISRLWEKCRKKQDGTFGALYMFSCLWCEEVGYEIPPTKSDNKGDNDSAASKENGDRVVPPTESEAYSSTTTILNSTTTVMDSITTVMSSTTAVTVIETATGSEDSYEPPSHGWHHFPLEPLPERIDRVMWHVMWRQGWFNVIIVQTILLVPDLINTFVAWLWMGAWIA